MMRALRRPLRGLHVAIVVSVALNLFCLALIGEQAWSRHVEERVALQIGDGGEALSLRTVLRQLVEKLPPGDAALLRAGFIARIPDLMALRRESVQAMDRVRADIAERPFNAEKTRTDMLASREARQKTAAVIQDTLLDVLPRMSDAGRRELAEYRLLPVRN
jgi:hypothetical protein